MSVSRAYQLFYAAASTGKMVASGEGGLLAKSGPAGKGARDGRQNADRGCGCLALRTLRSGDGKGRSGQPGGLGGALNLGEWAKSPIFCVCAVCVNVCVTRLAVSPFFTQLQELG